MAKHNTELDTAEHTHAGSVHQALMSPALYRRDSKAPRCSLGLDEEMEVWGGQEGPQFSHLYAARIPSVTLGPGSVSLSSIAHGLSSACTSLHSCIQPAPGSPSPPPGCCGHLRPTCSNKVTLVSLIPPFLLPHSPHLSFQLSTCVR